MLSTPLSGIRGGKQQHVFVSQCFYLSPQMVMQLPIVGEVLSAMEASYLPFAGVGLRVHRQLDLTREGGSAASPRANVIG